MTGTVSTPGLLLFMTGAAAIALAHRVDFHTEVLLVVFGLALVATGFMVSYPG
jgi:hypothetical protein